MMLSGSQFTPAVIITFLTAVFISVGSLYYSHRYLPRKIEHAYRNSLYSLAAAVETKDFGTVGHAKRVADYSVTVARELGLPSKQVRWIEYAALLRDIGKANIPHKLLNKEEPLSAEEWAQIQRHSQFGSEIVTSVPFLAPIADLVLHHHECWDGNGYPDGLIREDIPLGSRIIAVADDYDAMVSDRPYHAAQKPVVAENAIAYAAGGRYDPAVVDAFLRVLNREKGRT
jgi:putative nucleotidyltransferase with HDIG domain